MAFTAVNQRIGEVDLSTVAVAAGLGAPFSTSNLPSVTVEPFLGEIAYGNNNGTPTGGGVAGVWGEFIWLAVPTSTAITAGLIYRWNAATYRVIVVPTAVSSQALSGVPVAVAINAVSSNASSVQYTWFQISGQATVLKDAVQVAPDIALYVSGATAGRVRVIASAFRTIIGARSANLATVTTTTSTVLMAFNRPNLAPGI